MLAAASVAGNGILEPGGASPLAETIGNAAGGACCGIFPVDHFVVADRARGAFRTSGSWLVAVWSASSATGRDSAQGGGTVSGRGDGIGSGRDVGAERRI